MPPKIFDIGFPDRRYLDAAQGWLGLGNLLEAESELQRISPNLQTHPEVLELRWKTLSSVGNWDLAAKVARTLSELMPFAARGHALLAQSLKNQGRIEDACRVLTAVVDKFPKDWCLRYDLACYTCQLGQFKTAGEWLINAMNIAGAKQIKKMAVDEPDLTPLWESSEERSYG